MVTSALLLILMFTEPAHATEQPSGVFIGVESALSVAEVIATREGYSLPKRDIDSALGSPYWFESDGCSSQNGFAFITFNINTHPRNHLAISLSTGQVIDEFSCEVFEYPELQRFQTRIRELTHAPKKTPNQLADEVGCENPTIVTRSTPAEPGPSPHQRRAAKPSLR